MKTTTDGLVCSISPDGAEDLSTLDVEEVRDLLRDKTCLYFSGFDVTTEDFVAFTARFGQTAPLRTMPEAAGPQLGFHAEDAYNAWRPDTVWFLCVAEGSGGGIPTEILDGAELLKRIDRSRAPLLDRGLRFTQTWPQEEWKVARDAGSMEEITAFLDSLAGYSHEFLPDGTLQTTVQVPMVVEAPGGVASFSNTMLHAVRDPAWYGVTLGDGEPIPQDFIDHVGELAEELTTPVGWRAGDVAVIDNTRLMHRRGQYTGVGRDVRVIHGETFFGGEMPSPSTEATQIMKQVLQGELLLR